MKFHLALAISFLIHFALGILFIVNQKRVSQETNEQFMLDQPQKIVVSLTTAFPTSNPEVTPQPEAIKVARQKQPKNSLAEKKQQLAKTSQYTQTSIPSKRSPLPETLASTPLKSAIPEEAEVRSFSHPDEQNSVKKDLHANLPLKTENHTKRYHNLTSSEDSLRGLAIVTNPVYLKWKKPVYPRQSIAKNQEGKVLVDARVDAWGQVIDLEVYKSSGYPLLDRAAIKSVKHWVFEPIQQHGMKIGGMVRVPVSFVIAQK
jgi:TonB family protein